MRLAGVCCSLGVLAASHALVVRPAVAQARDAAAGEALFQEGRRLMKSGELAAACPKFEESLRLDPAMGTLVNLAACEEQLGRTATAWQHWRAAADQLPTGDKRRATAVARAAALEKVLPRLVIAPAAELPPDAEVRRDGVRLGAASFGLPLPVDPGKHQVVVTAPGREPRRYEVNIKPRENRTLAVELGAPLPADAPPSASAPPPPPPREAVSPLASAGGGLRVSDEGAPQGAMVRETPGRDGGGRSGSSRLLGWGLLGGAAVAAGVAVYAGLQALDARAVAKAECSAGDAGGGGFCRRSAKDALDRDRTFSLVTDLSAGAGAVLAGAGLYFLLRDGGGDAPRASIDVTPLPGGGAARLAGRF